MSDPINSGNFLYYMGNIMWLGGAWMGLIAIFVTSIPQEHPILMFWLALIFTIIATGIFLWQDIIFKDGGFVEWELKGMGLGFILCGLTIIISSVLAMIGVSIELKNIELLLTWWDTIISGLDILKSLDFIPFLSFLSAIPDVAVVFYTIISGCISLFLGGLALDSIKYTGSTFKKIIPYLTGALLIIFGILLIVSGDLI